MNVYEIQKSLLKAQSEEEIDEIISEIELDQMVDLIKMLTCRLSTIGVLATLEAENGLHI